MAWLQVAADSAPVKLYPRACLAIGETVILLTLPLHLVGVSIDMERECQQNDSLADGYACGHERKGLVSGLLPPRLLRLWVQMLSQIQ